MLRFISVSALLISIANTGMAEITEWGGAGGGYEIVDYTVLITAPGTYYFQSITDGEPDYIQWVRVDGEIAAGTVTIYIDQDPNDGDGVGASDVQEIDLSNATIGRVAHPSRSEGWGRDSVEEAVRSNDAPNREARRFV